MKSVVAPGQEILQMAQIIVEGKYCIQSIQDGAVVTVHWHLDLSIASSCVVLHFLLLPTAHLFKLLLSPHI